VSAHECDFSEEYFISMLGPEVVADIRRSVDGAPDPSPELVERLRRIFAPTVRQMLAEADTGRPAWQRAA